MRTTARSRRLTSPASVVLAVALTVVTVYGQRRFGGPGRYGASTFATSDSFDGSWHFCRLAYSGRAWATDYPDADYNFSIRVSELTKRHDLPYHVVGSDLAGVVLRTGAGVTRWKPGDRVVAHCLSVELESPDGHDDTMLDPEQRIWGFETNFGGLAQLALVKSNQLMPKPEHLTWEEAASPGLVNCTAYRQLVSKNGGDMKQGDNVLIWGASGGLGGDATQVAINRGAVPVCVVSSPEKAELCPRLGAELVIDGGVFAG